MRWFKVHSNWNEIVMLRSPFQMPVNNILRNNCVTSSSFPNDIEWHSIVRWNPAFSTLEKWRKCLCGRFSRYADSLNLSFWYCGSNICADTENVIYPSHMGYTSHVSCRIGSDRNGWSTHMNSGLIRSVDLKKTVSVRRKIHMALVIEVYTKRPQETGCHWKRISKDATAQETQT
jgi:hypothetical protein